MWGIFVSFAVKTKMETRNTYCYWKVQWVDSNN